VERDFELLRRGRNVSVITRAETTFVERMVVKFARRLEGVAVPGCRPKIPALRTRMSRCPWVVLMNSNASLIDESDVMSSWRDVTVPRTPGVDCRSLAAEAPRDSERDPRRMWYLAEWRRRFLAVS
jgi:hypothetical protein